MLSPLEPAHVRVTLFHCSLTASVISLCIPLSILLLFQSMALAWLLSRLPRANPTSITSFDRLHTSSTACWTGLCWAMLSGTWRRSVGHQQPAAAPVVASRGMTVCGVPSGTVVLEAQYDYNYRGADGRQVCIREGERFILLKKTNTDWWQVRKEFIFCLSCVCRTKDSRKPGHLHHPHCRLKTLFDFNEDVNLLKLSLILYILEFLQNANSWVL